MFSVKLKTEYQFMENDFLVHYFTTAEFQKHLGLRFFTVFHRTVE